MDYISIGFESGDAINVYNQCKLEPHPPPVTNVILEQVIESQVEVSLHFSGGVKLTINLRDEAYNGPEAIEWLRADGQYVIWRGD
jgi:hypothetical protein